MASKYQEVFDICKGLNDSIRISNTLTIKSYNVSAKIYCRFTTAFIIEGSTGGKITVNFTNLSIGNGKTPGDITSRPSKCRNGRRGIIHTKNTNLYVKKCYFQDLCTAISVAPYIENTGRIEVTKSFFIRVSYAFYSKETGRISANFRSTTFVGNAKDDTTSYGISLQTVDMIQLNIQGCYFRHFHEGISLTLKSSFYNIHINSSYFTDIKGQVIIAKFMEDTNTKNSTFLITNSTFLENRGFFSSSLHLVGTSSNSQKQLDITAHIDQCLFLNNEGLALFGTIYANRVFLEISNAYFENNVAGEQHGTVQGFGGAIYVETDTTVHVVNSTFNNNTSTGFGGAVFSRGSFSCINCTFFGARSNVFRPLLGDILYATSELTLTNTTWRSTAMDANKYKPLIWHPGSPTVESWKISVNGYFDVICPAGHNISESGVVRNITDLTTRLTLSCKPCPRSKYSLTSGSLSVVQNNGMITKHVKKVASCYNCKYGGVCRYGSIRPQANYYGFKTSDESGEVFFMSCPTGYCCKGNECQRYDSCERHRRGFLCGQCKKGLGENLINSSCVDPEECDDLWWLLPIYLICGVVYIFFFMYLDHISEFVRSQLLWWERHLPFHQDLTDYEKVHIDGSVSNLHDESGVGRDGMSGTSGEAPGTSTGQRFRAYTGLPDDNIMIFDRNGRRYKRPDVFTDFVQLTFYFFQMFLLIRMRESIVLEYVMTELRSIYSSIFTMSIETNSHPFVVCPIPYLTAVSKLLLIKSFSFYVLGLMFSMHGVIYLIQLFKDDWNTEIVIHVSIRLKVATIRILQLAYATLTTTVMTLVSCVSIGGRRSVLLVDGSIACYKWWQIATFVVVIGWVAPFPATLVYSLVHLKNNVITYREFILAWIFPLPYLIWCFWRWYDQTCRSTDHVDTARRVMEGDIVECETEMDQSIYEILYRIESPYKGTGNHLLENERREYENINIPEPAFWSGVLIGRRLILIIVFTFIQAPVLRLYIALILCLAYLVHHLYYQPYLNTISNVVETVSSSILVVFCSMNLFFAYSYVSDLAPEMADKDIALLFRWFEAVLLVILPSIVAVIFLLLVLTRLLTLCYRGTQYLLSNC